MPLDVKTLLCLSAFFWLCPSFIGCSSTGDHDGVKLLHMNFQHVLPPMSVVCWFVVITIAKTAAVKFPIISQHVPESALQLAIGVPLGLIFHFMDPTEEVYLQPDWFFLYLLPPIVLDAGFFLSNKDFFQNIGTIMVYAIFGTLWNIGMIGLTLYMLSSYFTVQMSFIELMLFATLISAVDPVAVIGVFERLHVNALLHICVFGESLLNDVVTVVLYKTLSMMAKVGTGNLTVIDYVTAGGSFVFISVEGIVVGVMAGLLTALVTKYAQINPLQPLIVLLFPYLSYLISEGFGQSGILTIAVCGVVMRQYVSGNMNRKSQIASENCLKMLSSSCEAMIFIFLGVSFISPSHEFDVPFIAVTLVACFVYRFIGVCILTYFVNQRRANKINKVNQFIMGYGGLRGAICYGLVMSIDEETVPSKRIFFTTTIAVILTTVFAQGLTIKPIAERLHVASHDQKKNILLEHMNNQAILDIMAGIEIITGYHGLNRFQKSFENFNDKYLKKYLMIKQVTPADKLVRKYEQMQIKEAAKFIRSHGSYPAFPTSHSQVLPQLPSSQSEILTHRTEVSELGTNAPNTSRIPANLSYLLLDGFAKANAGSLYSRHYVDDEADNSVAVDTHCMTYPSSRGQHFDFLRGFERQRNRIPKCSEIFAQQPERNGPSKATFSLGTEETEMSTIPPKRVEFKLGDAPLDTKAKGSPDEVRLLMPIDEEQDDMDSDDLSDTSM